MQIRKKIMQHRIIVFMGDPNAKCGCGRPVKVQKSQECGACYQRRRVEVLKRGERFVVPSIGPCTYETAHFRIARRRGRAATYECECGEPAEEWAYRGESPTEQEGTRTRRRRGVPYTIRSTWSGNPDDYDPLCRRCHARRDGRTDWGVRKARLNHRCVCPSCGVVTSPLEG